MTDTRRRIYLDYNATSPLDARARAAVVAALDVDGNPSSVHAEGRRARDLVERARRAVAQLLGGHPDEIVFTSGGTEADWLAVTGLARAARAAGARARVVAAPTEHPAVLGAVRALADDGFEVRWLPVSAAGVVDPDDVARAAAGGAALVTVALANHELGTVQDVAAIAARARAAGAAVHCDAVQAAGRVPVDVRDLGVDAVAVSAHKLHGPKGVGALWLAPGRDLAPAAGGHQERGRRPGTENVPGIAGFGSAAAAAADGLADAARQRALRERLERGLIDLGARIHAAGAPRLPNTVNAAFPGVPGDVLVAALDLAGFAVSTGAACTSGRVEPSPVLLATGLSPERAGEAIRISLGRETRPEEIDALLEVLPGIVSRIRNA